MSVRECCIIIGMTKTKSRRARRMRDLRNLAKQTHLVRSQITIAMFNNMTTMRMAKRA